MDNKTSAYLVLIIFGALFIVKSISNRKVKANYEELEKIKQEAKNKPIRDIITELNTHVFS